MAELENQVEETFDDVETTETNNDVSDDYSELTEADYYALQERLKKAEDTIVKYKKQAKGKSEDGDVITKTDLELVRFVDKNPEYEWKEDEIKSYLKKWLSLNEAKKLVSPNEEVINKNKTKQASITAWEWWWEQTTYTKEELAWLSQSEYNRVMDLKEAWKVVIKG